MTTILAIVLGTGLGNYLYAWTRPLGQSHWWISASVLWSVAGLGVASSLLMRPMRSANPSRRFPLDFASQTYRDLATLAARRPVLLAALGSALFWSLASLMQLNVDQLATRSLGMAQQHVGPLLGVLALGVGIGNVLSGWISRGRIELGIVPVAALGIAAGGILLSTVPNAHGDPFSAGYFLAAAWLFVLGTAAGMYDVPLQAFIQHRTPEASRGTILAAANFIANAGMIVASVVFFLLRGPLQLSGRGIFLVCGLAMLPIAAVLFWRVPIAGLRHVLRRLTPGDGDVDQVRQ
jgi:acyl-[acyl-carrier-protein]-phospholipid O-acyltransferase / long-chain-fatty-acid--[acyl-carrier-protein] ligase